MNKFAIISLVMIFLFIFLISMGNKDIEVTCSDAELQ